MHKQRSASKQSNSKEEGYTAHGRQVKHQKNEKGNNIHDEESDGEFMRALKKRERSKRKPKAAKGSDAEDCDATVSDAEDCDESDDSESEDKGGKSPIISNIFFCC